MTNTTTTLARANRIAVQTTNEGFKADFYRTHKKLTTIFSEETTWMADESMNKSAQREDFRRFAIENANTFGINYDPADKRELGNVRVAKYESEHILMVDAMGFMAGDVAMLISKCPYGVEYESLMAESVAPVTHSAKGTDLSTLGIIDGRYEKSGNWAWADVEMTLTLRKAEQVIYYSFNCQLVSGQLKKPHITQTAFNESIKESLKEVGLWEEESKESKDSKDAEQTVSEEVKVEESKESKPKKSRKSKKADQE